MQGFIRDMCQISMWNKFVQKKTTKQAIIVFENSVWQAIEQGCTWERAVLLTQQQKLGKFHSYPLYPSVLLILDIAPRPQPRGQTVPVKCYALLTPICPILCVCAHQAEARIEHLVCIVSLKFDEQGAPSSILEFLRFLKKIKRAFCLRGWNLFLSWN